MHRIGRYSFVWLAGLAAFSLIAAAGDGYQQRVWTTTLLLGLMTAAVALPTGFVIAWLLFRRRVWGTTPAIALLAAWLLMPLYLQAAAWQAVLDRCFGSGSLGGWRALPSGFWGACWVHSAAAIPWSAAAMAWAIRLLPRSWEEQVALERRSRRAWWEVTWPHWLAASSIAATWVFMAVATDITATDLFQVETFAETIYVQFALGKHPEFAALSWESVLMTAWLGGLIVSGVLTAMAPIGEATERFDRPSSATQPGVLESVVLWSLLIVAFGIPIAMLAHQAGLETIQVDGGWARRWSASKLLGAVLGLGPHRRQFVVTQFHSEWFWTSIIMFVGAGITTFTAAAGAWAAYRRRRWAWCVLTAVVVLWSVPSPLWGIWMAKSWTWLDWPWLFWLYDRTIMPPVVAGLIRAWPLAVLIWWAGYRSLPPRLTDELRLAGWGFWRQWALVAIPARRWLVPLVAMTSGALIFGEIGATLLVIPPGMLTITIRVFDLLHAGVDDLAAAICLVLILLTVAYVWLLGSPWRWTR